MCVEEYVWARSPKNESASDLSDDELDYRNTSESSGSETSTSSESDSRERRKRKKSKKRRRKKRIESSSESDSDSSKRRKKRKKEKSKRKQEEKEEPEIQIPETIQETVQDESSQLIFGPQPIQIKQPISYGKDLLPGEGSAIASFVQQNKRIPRRGEVGIDNNDIEKFENLGYIMSGDRNKRLTAVRVRKEQQVISAEEQKKQILQQFEERLKRENELIAQFRNMIEKK